MAVAFGAAAVGMFLGQILFMTIGPKLLGNIVFLGRVHPSLNMCLGHAWAEPVNALSNLGFMGAGIAAMHYIGMHAMQVWLHPADEQAPQLADGIGVVLHPQRDVARDERRALASSSFRDFDDAVTSRLHGFRDADDYYSTSSCARFLHAIRVPTLLVHALQRSNADDAVELQAMDADDVHGRSRSRLVVRLTR